eukprot:1453576-Lingulodinium_polyedra.AAC.1
MEYTRGDSQVSDYHLHGFDMLGDEAVQYAVVAAMTSRGIDTMLGKLLEDDRLALRSAEVEESMKEQQTLLENLDQYTWARLSSLVDDWTANSVQDRCLQAYHVAQAYAKKKVFVALHDYPWKLLQGDRLANLRALPEVEGINDETTLKIQQLVSQHYSEDLLLDGLSKLADAKWTTAGVEQGHGSMALVHRCHKTMEAPMLSTRSHLHSVRLLLPLETKEDRMIKVQEERLQRLSRGNKAKTTGRHIYFGELMKSAIAALPQGATLSQESKEHIMSTHGRMYKALSAEQKAVYTAMAAASAEEKTSEQMQETKQLEE